jgi:hypothetical protein
MLYQEESGNPVRELEFWSCCRFSSFNLFESFCVGAINDNASAEVLPWTAKNKNKCTRVRKNGEKAKDLFLEQRKSIEGSCFATEQQTPIGS